MRLDKRVLVTPACKRGKVDECCYPKLYVEGEDARLVACDGDIIVSVPVPPDQSDRTGLIPHDAMRAARMHASREKDSEGQMTLLCGDTVNVPEAGQQHERPAVEGSMFDEFDVTIPELGREGEVELPLDAKQLFMLARAMGSNRVKLTFTPGQLANNIRVEPVQDGWAPAGTVGAMAPAIAKAKPQDDDPQQGELPE